MSYRWLSFLIGQIFSLSFYSQTVEFLKALYFYILEGKGKKEEQREKSRDFISLISQIGH